METNDIIGAVFLGLLLAGILMFLVVGAVCFIRMEIRESREEKKEVDKYFDFDCGFKSGVYWAKGIIDEKGVLKIRKTRKKRRQNRNTK